ncbi:RxLR-like protein [Plasmopara halstedii]|uniref:RxLR-like protein n=1 Tax=Plasmopara halstedii TaxID=4781 RepID=A0A0P1ALH1_PLAHL|nr:RxLR-like protein [Plasmopara halstedii]CEG42253.1 RxLR-like protein [Plasmopara halstedii]|eukprot:XP_024578622.1 RxLR-like protein [Plasmopara halstedii]
MIDKRNLSTGLRLLLLSSIAFLACPGPSTTNAAMHGFVASNNQTHESTLTPPSAEESEERLFNTLEEETGMLTALAERLHKSKNWQALVNHRLVRFFVPHWQLRFSSKYKEIANDLFRKNFFEPSELKKINGDLLSSKEFKEYSKLFDRAFSDQQLGMKAERMIDPLVENVEDGLITSITRVKEAGNPTEFVLELEKAMLNKWVNTKTQAEFLELDYVKKLFQDNPNGATSLYSKLQLEKADA